MVIVCLGFVGVSGFEGGINKGTEVQKGTRYLEKFIVFGEHNIFTG